MSGPGPPQILLPPSCPRQPSLQSSSSPLLSLPSPFTPPSPSTSSLMDTQSTGSSWKPSAAAKKRRPCTMMRRKSRRWCPSFRMRARKSSDLVAHSYGGVVACEPSKGLAKREKEGKQSGIVIMVFVPCWKANIWLCTPMSASR
ncbi:hypothetical protein B0H19DRAFT_1144988 [Mycena capillaripes]|nr:hypothetical protein B0H19DRAFT_1144988 [Mycena capillaripes]